MLAQHYSGGRDLGLKLLLSYCLPLCQADFLGKGNIFCLDEGGRCRSKRTLCVWLRRRSQRHLAEWSFMVANVCFVLFAILKLKVKNYFK
jgi:hypothetical protein